MSKFNSRVSVFELADAEAIKAQSDDGGAFTDESTAANNAIANDMTLLPAVEMIDDAYYLGSLLATFDGVVLDIGTSGVGNTVVFEYGTTAPSTYSALTVSDETAGLTAAVGKRLISFAAPSDWVKTTVNTIEGYWIRIRCTVASFTTQPLGTEAWLVRNIAEYITDASGLPGERELIDTSTLGDSGRTRSPSLENAKISISGWYDDTGYKGPDAILGVLQDHTNAHMFYYGPKGKTSTYLRYSGLCWVRNYVVTSKVGDMVAWTADIETESTITRGTYT